MLKFKLIEKLLVFTAERVALEQWGKLLREDNLLLRVDNLLLRGG